MTAGANNDELGPCHFSSFYVAFVVVIDSKATGGGGEYLSVDYQYKYQYYD